MFGSDVVVKVNAARGIRSGGGGGARRGGGGGRGRRNAGGGPAGSSKLSLTGKQRYASMYDNGLRMILDDEYHSRNKAGTAAAAKSSAALSSGCTRLDTAKIYKYKHEQAYQKHQFRFDDAMSIRDQQGILDLLHSRPHHIDTLLQLSGMFRSQEDYSYADDLVLRAIQELENSMHHQFRITDTNCALDYNVKENRGLFIALFYHMLAVARRRCFRASLEICKVLMRLSVAGDDPLAAMLIIDQYALRSHEFFWLVEFYESVNDELNLAMLPNFAYSVPLAYFYLSRGDGNVNCQRGLKGQLTEELATRTKEQFR